MLRAQIGVSNLVGSLEPTRNNNRSLHEFTTSTNDAAARSTSLFTKKNSSFPRRTSEKFVINRNNEFNEDVNRTRALTDLRRLSLCKLKTILNTFFNFIFQLFFRFLKMIALTMVTEVDN